MSCIHSEVDTIDSLNDYELIKYLESGLISFATGGDFECYEFVRKKVLENSEFSKLIPSWIKTSRDTKQFWAFIKKTEGYKGRREFIWSEFEPLLNYLEFKTTSPINDIINFDEAFIHQQWKKAIERQFIDPEGAITMARTLIESLCKHILDEQDVEYNENMDLSELYKKVAQLLNLAPEQHQEQIFKQILGGANGIISGLGAMRNKLGDSHGSTKNKIKPKERHSELAVNLAGSMSIFLFKTYKENLI